MLLIFPNTTLFFFASISPIHGTYLSCEKNAAFANDGKQETPDISAESETFDEVDLSADPVQEPIDPETLEDSSGEPGAPVDIDEPIEKVEPEVSEVPEDVLETIDGENAIHAVIEEETVEAGMSNSMVISKVVMCSKNARKEKKSPHT